MSVNNKDTNPDKIKHVVVLAMENRSFDQMLGGMQAEMPDIDGVFAADGGPRSNRTDKNVVYEQAVIYSKQIKSDPKHERGNVEKQLKGNNEGFIDDFVASYPESTEEDRQHIMGFYPAGFLPALHTLARNFAVCHRWYASVPGPTWPNRMMLLSGTTRGKIHMPENGKNFGMVGTQIQPTIFDRLNEKKKSWKVYKHDLPSSWLLLNQLKKENRGRYFPFGQFKKDAEREETFPEFVFIEPQYYGKDENDDHPPHNVMKGQKLIADVYNAIRGNPALWESTLFVVLYDEHGGFYDHVIPPKAVPPGVYEKAEYAFDQLGVRVPALLISPWVKKGVIDDEFDHTSVLRYLIDKWELGELGDRTAAAKSIECALQYGAPLLETPEKIVVTEEQLATPYPELEDDAISGHNQAVMHLRTLVKNQLVLEATEDLALLARDPHGFKVRVYPWLELLGYGVRWLGKVIGKLGQWLVDLNRDFQHEEIERVAKEMQAVALAARGTPTVSGQEHESPLGAVILPKSDGDQDPNKTTDQK